MALREWLSRWQNNNIGFHQTDVEPLLVKHFSSIAPATVLVPLCGKSLDMLWLLKKGWQVIGVEASAIACRSFFEENKLPFRVIQHKDFALYRGEQITIFCGDFFKMESIDLSGVTAIYDRAALIAMPKDLRTKYVDTLKKLLPLNVQTLLITLDYPQEEVVGPPFSVDELEVKRLYSDSFKVTLLERAEDKNISQTNVKFKGLRVFESAYKLER